MANHLGQQLGKYRLTQLLGTGGFAEVYLGVHIHLGTEAAIKLLHAQLATEAEGEKFRQEARTVAALIHPNIVRVLDFDIEESTPYLVMDYAPNGSLRQILPAGTPLAPASITPYLVQVAAALQYAHDQKLVHRDIKPENMLLGRRNEVLLSDFGIATAAQTTSQQKTEGVAGTAAYMAPEQLHGKPRPSSDLYSLAVVLYEWLAGERPFQGSFVEIASQHLFTPPPPLREKVPGISPAVEQVVMTALAKDPKDRFGSVRAFANAFLQASGAGTSLTSFETRIAPSGAQLSSDPAGSSGIIVSADSQLTPHITPQLSAASDPNAASDRYRGSPLPQPSVPLPGPQIGQAGPSILSATTQITPAASFGPPAVGSQPPQALFYAETQLTPPTAGTAFPQAGTGPTPAAFAASGPGVGSNEKHSVTYLPPGWHSPSGPPAYDGMERSQTSLSGPPVPGMPPESGSKRKSGRRLAVIALVAVLALALIGGGAAYVLLGGLIQTGASATRVTITPKSSDLKLTSNITGVTGTPDASQAQVQARTVSVTSAGGTKTAQATGQQTTPGTHAHGTAYVVNYDTANPLTLDAGSTYQNNNGCASTSYTIVLDATVNLPPAPIGDQSTTTAPVHILQVGPISGDPNNPTCAPLLGYAGGSQTCSDGTNNYCTQIEPGTTGDWTDGTNPQTETIVQQSDIDNAASSLIQANQPNAQQVVQGQLQPNEQLAGSPQCTPKTSADHNVGDVANQVTVTVTFTCTGVAYDHDGALSLAAKLLTNQAASTLGAGYALAGQIKKTLVSATPDDQGNVAIVVNSEGIWAYQISAAQKQAFASLVAGKSKQQALSLLDTQMGIARVSIQISGGNGQSLPANAGQITITVLTVSGL